MCDHVCELCGFKCVCSLVTFLSFQKFFTSSPLLGCIAWVGRSQVVPFIEFFYGGCVIGRLSKITIKPGLCTKPEFGTIGSKRYLTGGQYYKIGALRLFGPNGQLHSRRNFSMNGPSVLMNVTFRGTGL